MLVKDVLAAAQVVAFREHIAARQPTVSTTAVNMGARRTRVDLPIPEDVKIAIRDAIGKEGALICPLAHCYTTVGGAVSPHKDAPERIAGSCVSTHSLLLYLTTATTGATLLCEDGVEVLPVAGHGLLMPHALTHAVNPFHATPAEPIRVVALVRVYIPP